MNDESRTPRLSHWRFGPGWSGRRCGARTRAGHPCQKPALTGKARCQLHGGRAGAPKGARNGNYKTGHYTAEAIEWRKLAHARIRQLIILGKSIGMFD